MKYPMLVRAGGCHSVYRHEGGRVRRLFCSKFTAPPASDEVHRDIAAEITGERYKTGFGATRPTIDTGPRVAISSAHPRHPIVFFHTLKDAFGRME